MLSKRVFVIAGSRDFPDETQVKIALSRVLQPGDVVIAGGARGVDTWAEQHARWRQCRVEIMRADWSKGRGAGHQRNRAMLDRLVKARELGWQVQVICFWDQVSRGTKNTIDTAEQLNIDCVVIVPQ